MGLRVMVVADGMVETGEGMPFHCLTGDAFERVYHVTPSDAIEQYKETVVDGWDVIIVDHKCPREALGIAAKFRRAIPAMEMGTTVFVLNDRCKIPTPMAWGVVIPRDGEQIQGVFTKLGFL